MNFNQLKKEAELFFEWPSETHEYVTLTSAIIFAQVMILKHNAELKRHAPCKNFCEKNDLVVEIEKLKRAIIETIEDNLHLSDGENCALIKLQRAINC